MTPHPRRSGATAPVASVGCVWVVSRHLLVAQALAAALSRRGADIRVLARDASLGDQAPFQPRDDMLLVLDDLRSAAAVASIRTLSRETGVRTVVMTTSPRGPLWGALLEGRDRIDIITEPQTTEGLTAVIEAVRADVPVIGVKERAELVEGWRHHLQEEEELAERFELLTPRELVVLQSLASGRRAAEISETLEVAQSTVRTHIRSIRRKLEVDSQLRAVLAYHRVQSRTAPPAVAVPAPRRDGDQGSGRPSAGGSGTEGLLLRS